MPAESRIAQGSVWRKSFEAAPHFSWKERPAWLICQSQRGRGGALSAGALGVVVGAVHLGGGVLAHQ